GGVVITDHHYRARRKQSGAYLDKHLRNVFQRGRCAVHIACTRSFFTGFELQRSAQREVDYHDRIPPFVSIYFSRNISSNCSLAEQINYERLRVDGGSDKSAS